MQNYDVNLTQYIPDFPCHGSGKVLYLFFFVDIMSKHVICWNDMHVLILESLSIAFVQENWYTIY